MQAWAAGVQKGQTSGSSGEVPAQTSSKHPPWVSVSFGKDHCVHESASSTRWNLRQWHALLASSSLPIVVSACFGQSKEACKAAQATSWDAGQPNNSCTKAGSMRPHGRAQSGLRQSAYGGGQVSVEGVLKNGTMPFLPNSPSNLFQAPPSIGHP